LRRGRKAGAGLCATAVVGASYWLLHGSIDWFWEIPATTAPVFAALGIAAALAGAAEPAEPDQPSRRGRSEARVAVATAAGAVAAVAAASYVFPLVSALYVRDATHSWRGDARAAFAALDRARRLNPLSDRPDLVKGAIASRLAEPEQMRRAFGAAVERNPDSWYGLLELGIAESLTGNRQQALAHLARAAELDPLETVIVRVERDVRAGKPVDPQEIDAIFLSRVAGSARTPGGSGAVIQALTGRETGAPSKRTGTFGRRTDGREEDAQIRDRYRDSTGSAGAGGSRSDLSAHGLGPPRQSVRSDGRSPKSRSAKLVTA
jgi:tetratricopeptide (TPR) repeat protein